MFVIFYNFIYISFSCICISFSKHEYFMRQMLGQCREGSGEAEQFMSNLFSVHKICIVALCSLCGSCELWLTAYIIRDFKCWNWLEIIALPFWQPFVNAVEVHVSGRVGIDQWLIHAFVFNRPELYQIEIPEHQLFLYKSGNYYGMKKTSYS
jgi:hypothetical protein